jgi:hypothetical protein
MSAALSAPQHDQLGIDGHDFDEGIAIGTAASKKGLEQGHQVVRDEFDAPDTIDTESQRPHRMALAEGAPACLFAAFARHLIEGASQEVIGDAKASSELMPTPSQS